MILNNYIIKISKDKYRYFKCNFDGKKIIMHTLLKKKHVLLCCEQNKIERKLIFMKSLIFFFFFLFYLFIYFFSHLVKIWYAKCKVLPSNRKIIFYRNLHNPIQGRLSSLIPISVLHNFAEKNAKISVFLATMIRLWCTLTSLCTVISGSSLRRLLFVIIINFALMPPWLVENSKKN